MYLALVQHDFPPAAVNWRLERDKDLRGGERESRAMMNGKSSICPCIFHQSSCLPISFGEGSSHGNKDKGGQSEKKVWKRRARERESGRGKAAEEAERHRRGGVRGRERTETVRLSGGGKVWAGRGRTQTGHLLRGVTPSQRQVLPAAWRREPREDGDICRHHVSREAISQTTCTAARTSI